MELYTELTLPVLDLGSEGRGICKTDRLVIFVPNTVPGDVIRLRIDSIEKNYATGTCLAVLSSSPYRQEPDCLLYSKCGGCNMRHMLREQELLYKEDMVRQALRRVGITAQVNKVLHASPYEYRNKAVFHMDEAGKVGYYESKSHKVLSGLKSCQIIPRIFGEIAEFTERYWAQIPSFAALRPCALYLRKNHSDETLVSIQTPHMIREEGEAVLRAYAQTLKNSFQNTIIGVLHCDLPNGKYTVPTFTVIEGGRYVTDTILNLSIRLSPEGFYQVNHEGAQILAEIVLRIASQCAFSTAADLYCGSGFFGLLLARSFPGKSIYGIEINADSIRDAKVNQRMNGLKNIQFFCGDASAFAEESHVRPEFMLIDPPRAGCSDKVRRQIFELSPDTLVYVSCNPLTLARDLGVLQEKYRIETIQPVDMFPGTCHVETVVWLSRKIDMHNMKLHPTPFELIKSRQKTIELRLFDEKRQKIKVGDVITFTNTSNDEQLSTIVKNVHRFDNFEELYKTLPLLQCGYTAANVDKAHPSDMEQYYSVEEQNTCGVVGIELFLL